MSGDRWSAWLKERRHGGDEERLRGMQPTLERFRATVLANAGVRPGETVLDVGCGDGLIGFGALELVGDDGRVIFNEISEELLDVCRERADGDPRCEFLLGRAEELPLADESVDVVTTRSVIIYVAEKQRAFDEFLRVLRPGGRLSVFEPINNYAFPEPGDRFFYYDVTPVAELADKVKAEYNRREAPEARAMIDFDERDLVSFAERAGFSEVHLEFRIDVAPTEPIEWQAFEASSPNPLAPTLSEAIGQALNPDEAERFRAHLRRQAEAGQGMERGAVAYLWALKR